MTNYRHAKFRGIFDIEHNTNVFLYSSLSVFTGNGTEDEVYSGLVEQTGL